MVCAQNTVVSALPEVKTQPTIQVKNPFMWTDAPDPDIIRVGDYYYLVTTTMHLFPGAPIMRSTDLAHWETVSYLFDEIKDTPRYDLREGTVYGR
ncbi:MAG: family 43 glycosylhydrolase, partial [Bacteroidaceae bacterium]|nr:family 43 glycosylhydrolase [Bacteroidaceae bacterium]